MNKIIIIISLSLIFLNCKERVNVKKQNELADLSEQIFHQKKINFEEVLNLIKNNTTSKNPDSSNFAEIYSDQSARTYFKVYEEPKGIILFMAYFRNDKEIYAAEYYDNGIIRCKFNTSREGIRNGKFECYFKNGNIKSKGEYLNNRPIGIETEYDSLGNITYEFDYNKL